MHAQIIIWIFCVPKEGKRQRPARNASTQDVGAIERKFRLKQSRRGHTRESDERVICQDRYAIERNPMTIRFHPPSFRIELARGGLFEDVGTIARNHLNQVREVLSGMKPCLIGKTNSGHTEVRN